MKTTSQFIGFQVLEGLHNAFRHLECYRDYTLGGLDVKVEPQYKRIQYSKDHNLVAIEFERSEFPENLPEGFFETKKAKAIFRGCFNGQDIDFMDLGTKLYFYFWVEQNVYTNVPETEPEKVPA